MPTLRATYRLQFNEHFRLTDALNLVPYLNRLGVSHLYASPLFAACPHSPHGYDVCDFGKLNPEIGTEADLERLVAALHERQMGLVLDIVPNHMGIDAPENGWWWDVLKHGEKSKFATHFDIDWRPEEKYLEGKILAPILGDSYETVLQKSELLLKFENGEVTLNYFKHCFPIAPETMADFGADGDTLARINADHAALDHLIQRQHYRLEHFGVGDAKINYRRFFAVSSLAAVRVEDVAVFWDVHALIRRWYEAGWVDGLRVDHPDGLRDPGGYLDRLRALTPKAWIVVEKILGPDEVLPSEWPVAGTTGYEFLNQLNSLFVDPAAEDAFTQFYEEFAGTQADYQSEVWEKKRLALKTLFVAELNRLAGRLARIASGDALAKKFTVPDLREALAEIIACYPVYRSYISERVSASGPDRANIEYAIRTAAGHRADISPDVFNYIRQLMLTPASEKPALDFIARWQQLTGPTMAKGVEDTVFFCFNRLASLNEVGGDPSQFGSDPESLHQFLAREICRQDAQLTTSTHDTKRSEDLRARLNVLSEIPAEWFQAVRRWSGINACHRRGEWPDRNLEYLFYQTLVGTWPLTVERAQDFVEKAARESKQHTSWSHPAREYEDAVKGFVSESLCDPQFKTDIERFVQGISEAAEINSLAQTLVKLTARGVPDIYQGCELWDLSLVDPDNRRPVDFKIRTELLQSAADLSPEQIWARRASGLPKLWLISQALQLRQQLPHFSTFDYQSLHPSGAMAEHAFAFARGGLVVTVVQRLAYKLHHDWAGTTLELPAGQWHNKFTGEPFTGKIEVENLFKKFPVALLCRTEN